jgi:NAD(P)-dependent dehydrogenase (short-subunit alcohol dehydrogenase family)
VSEPVASALLRPGLLRGVSLLIAGGAGDPLQWPLAGAVAEACTALGARVSVCAPTPAAEAELDLQVAAVLARSTKIDVLVLDGAALFNQVLHEGGDAQRALRDSLDAAWNATRSLVDLAFLGAGAGRVVYLGPGAEAQHAQGARAGLENLARTLSIEWARHAINTVAIAPGSSSSAGEMAALVAYLASPAGAYFSGCVLELGSG